MGKKATPRAKLRGKVEIRKLADFKCNSWNPNRMTDAMRASLEHGLVHDGWLVSQALLVWGTDDKGNAQNVIIDGEHRFRCALGLGLVEGPVVVLDGIPESEAKALTIKMNQKRGEFDAMELAGLVQSLTASGALESAAIGVDLGFTDDEVSRLLAVPLVVPENAPSPAPPTGPSATPEPAPSVEQPRAVALTFPGDEHAAFVEACSALATAWGTKTISETVARAVFFAVQEHDDAAKTDEETVELPDDFDPEADDI